MTSMPLNQSPFFDETKEFREDFELLTAMLKFSVDKNISAFTFSGLRVPELLQDWKLHDASAIVAPSVIASHVHELTLFQEHLHDRIVGVAHNDRMLRETWRINESTREFREREIGLPEVATGVVDLTVSLINALFLHEKDRALSIFDQCLQRRTDLAYRIADTIHDSRAAAS